jgi:DNA-binding response OmpR family regulator
MSHVKHDETVAVINSSEDTVEMLRYALQHHGFTSIVTAHVTDIRSGKLDFVSFLSDHDPKALVYDISIPYDSNWTFLKLLLDSEHMRGRAVVVTTTNKRRLEELVGATDAIEIVGKPYDLNVIVAAVIKSLEAA